MKQPTIPSDNNALPADNSLRVGNGLPAHRSKSELLAELMTRPQTLKNIGSAWFLYMHLALIKSGVWLATYDAMGKELGVNGRTVRNWVETLESIKIVNHVSKAKRIEIKLIGNHMKIANAPDRVVVDKPVDMEDADPKLRLLAETIQKAKENDIELNINWTINGEINTKAS